MAATRSHPSAHEAARPQRPPSCGISSPHEDASGHSRARPDGLLLTRSRAQTQSHGLGVRTPTSLFGVLDSGAAVPAGRSASTCRPRPGTWCVSVPRGEAWGTHVRSPASPPWRPPWHLAPARQLSQERLPRGLFSERRCRCQPCLSLPPAEPQLSEHAKSPCLSLRSRFYWQFHCHPKKPLFLRWHFPQAGAGRQRRQGGLLLQALAGVGASVPGLGSAGTEDPQSGFCSRCGCSAPLQGTKGDDRQGDGHHKALDRQVSPAANAQRPSSSRPGGHQGGLCVMGQECGG